MLQSSQANAKGHHVDEGITGQLLGPGGGIGQEVAADDLHQNAEAETDVEDGAQCVQNFHVALDELIQAFFHKGYDLSFLEDGMDDKEGADCKSVSLPRWNLTFYRQSISDQARASISS